MQSGNTQWAGIECETAVSKLSDRLPSFHTTLARPRGISWHAGAKLSFSFLDDRSTDSLSRFHVAGTYMVSNHWFRVHSV